MHNDWDDEHTLNSSTSRNACYTGMLNYAYRSGEGWAWHMTSATATATE
jgi:hypothetical protein